MEKIGHRGAKAWVDENTLESIQKAIELGADAVEIDVHVCKTGELIAIHDSTLKRTTNGKGKIVKLTYSQINSFNTINGHTIPTLEQVLDFCKDKCKIHIELKSKGTAIKTAKLITQHVDNNIWSYNQLVVSSFKLSRLKKIQEQNSNIRLGLIARKNLNHKLELAAKNNFFAFYAFHEKLRKPIVKLAKKHGLKIYCWTVNKRLNISKMLSLGVDGIITDNLEKL